MAPKVPNFQSGLIGRGLLGRSGAPTCQVRTPRTGSRIRGPRVRARVVETMQRSSRYKKFKHEFLETHVAWSAMIGDRC